MSESVLLEATAVEEMPFGEPRVVEESADPEDWCFCTCACQTKPAKASDANLTSVVLSVLRPQP